MNLNHKFASAWYLTKQAPRRIARAAKRNRYNILQITLTALFFALIYCVFFFLAFYLAMGIIALTGSAILALIGAITGAMIIGSFLIRPISYGYVYLSSFLGAKDYEAKNAPDYIDVIVVREYEPTRVYSIAQ